MKYVAPYGSLDPNASYTNGNAGAGIPGSIPDARAIEHPQREIVDVIASAGLTPMEGSLTQLRQAISAMIADGAVTLDIDGTMAANSDLVAPSQKAARTYIAAQIAALVAAAPAALDTLSELSAALGNDASFAATVTALIATKAANGANADITSLETVNTVTQPINDSSTKIATTAFANPANSLGASGYIKLASGLIMQWMPFGAMGVGSTVNVTFPIAFPTAVYSLSGTPIGVTQGTLEVVSNSLSGALLGEGSNQRAISGGTLIAIGK
ncbi:MAG: hypothetical protein SFW64_00270 [Alphaproteobacteria bacterium]|nr:hypothetical protein [Alphaproteobacteria bacterium]